MVTSVPEMLAPMFFSILPWGTPAWSFESQAQFNGQARMRDRIRDSNTFNQLGWVPQGVRQQHFPRQYKSYLHMLVAILVPISWLASPSFATAQRRVDPSTLYPIPGEVRYAGTYHLSSGTWTRPGDGVLSFTSGTTSVYTNTCSWTGGSLYLGLETCEVAYDEGRIPSTSDPQAPGGASDSNLITAVTFGYCVPQVPTGQVDIKLAFWNNLGGPCVGNIPPTPPPTSSTADAFIDLGAPAGFPLPGDPGTGNPCWIVTLDLSNTPFCLLSDGDGTYDGNPVIDSFTWAFEHNNPPVSSSPPGVLLAGEPMVAAPGSCSYDLPCGIDPTMGHPCGTGLGADDTLWINVDGVAAGSTGSGSCPTSSLPPPGGTNCYSFGYPGNPFASLLLQLESSDDCFGCSGNVRVYCTATTNSLGCTPKMGASGIPSASSGGGFVVTAVDIVPNVLGLPLYGTNGAASIPMLGGFLCVQPSIIRLAIQNSGSSGQPPCTGRFTADFNVHIASGWNPALIPGQQVWSQYWSRDPASVSKSNLTDAISFVICP